VAFFIFCYHNWWIVIFGNSGKYAVTLLYSDRFWYVTLLPKMINLFLGAGHLAWQVYTLDIHDKQDCFKKFVSNKWFGAIIFAGILASGTLL
jgi:4-hydroxybenzoate polyprenyltransferase